MLRWILPLSFGLAMLALVGAMAYVVVGGLPVVAGSLVVAFVLTVYHHAL